jgi:CO/xanthine dehydrogenase FAD-binding subunit
LLTAIEIPARAGKGRSHFLKLGARKYLVISIAMVAARIVVGGDDRVAEAAIAVGSCSAVAQRLPDAELALVGAAAEPAAASRIVAEHLAPLAPIDDVRATAEYRRAAALEGVRRAVAACLGPP